MKPTKEQIGEWIADEEKSAIEYEKYGLGIIAKDERRHAQILKRLLEKY